MQRLLALLTVAALVALAAACNGGDTGGSETSTPATTEEPAANTPTPPPDIRQQDFSQHPVLQGFLDSAGGEVRPEDIQYVDMTGDGVDEAIVPVNSGGEGGNIAVFVFGYGEGGLAAMLRVVPDAGSFTIGVAGNQLVTTQPVYGANDALCCPSQLRKTTYGWNGVDIVSTSSETVPATPPAGS